MIDAFLPRNISTRVLSYCLLFTTSRLSRRFRTALEIVSIKRSRLTPYTNTALGEPGVATPASFARKQLSVPTTLTWTFLTARLLARYLKRARKPTTGNTRKHTPVCLPSGVVSQLGGEPGRTRTPRSDGASPPGRRGKRIPAQRRRLLAVRA